MCSAAAARVLDRDVADRFVNVIAHEYIHSQQAPALAGTEDLTVLQRSLLEGIAEFVGELISWRYRAHRCRPCLRRGREKEIETRFAAAIDSKDLSAWVDNTTADRRRAARLLGGLPHREVVLTEPHETNAPPSAR